MGDFWPPNLGDFFLGGRFFWWFPSLPYYHCYYCYFSIIVIIIVIIVTYLFSYVCIIYLFNYLLVIWVFNLFFGYDVDVPPPNVTRSLPVFRKRSELRNFRWVWSQKWHPFQEVDRTWQRHIIYPPENYHDSGKSTIWRCISYWNWEFSNVMLVFRGLPFLP